MALTIKRISREYAPELMADWFIEKAKDSIAYQNKFTIAVSGGSTPLAFFKALSKRVNQLSFDQWNQVHFLWVDERWEPVSSNENNYGMAWREGLQSLPAHFHPFNTQLSHPLFACQAYESNFHQWVNQSIDWTILGAGTDGHTASIFKENWLEASLPVVAFETKHPQTGQVRVSLTISTILNSKEITVLLIGIEKQPILLRLKNLSLLEFPIQKVVSLAKNVVVVTDL